MNVTITFEVDDEAKPFNVVPHLPPSDIPGSLHDAICDGIFNKAEGAIDWLESNISDAQLIESEEERHIYTVALVQYHSQTGLVHDVTAWSRSFCSSDNAQESCIEHSKTSGVGETEEWIWNEDEKEWLAYSKGHLYCYIVKETTLIQ